MEKIEKILDVCANRVSLEPMSVAQKLYPVLILFIGQILYLANVGWVALLFAQAIVLILFVVYRDRKIYLFSARKLNVEMIKNHIEGYNKINIVATSVACFSYILIDPKTLYITILPTVLSFCREIFFVLYLKTVVTGFSDKIKSNEYIYLGTEIHNYTKNLDEHKITKTPAFIKDDSSRKRHTLIIGATGKGKTSSTLIPLAVHDIKSGKHTVVIDPKNDHDFANAIQGACKEAGKKMVFINFSRPELSDPYNPLSHGEPLYLKDKIMGAMRWSEPFYKAVADQEILKACTELIYSNSEDGLKKKNAVTLLEILPILEEKENTEGVCSFLKSLTLDSVGHILQVDPSAGAKRFWEDESIGAVYFCVPSEKSAEFSRQIGRLIFADYKTLSGHIKDIPDHSKRPMALYIDEAAKYIDEDFLDYLTLARSSNIRITIASQGISDFADHGEALLNGIMGNMETKIYMQTTSPVDAEKISKSIGTHCVKIYTSQIDKKNMSEETGTGSMREGREFIVHTDTIKKLGVGEAILVTNGNREVRHVYLDSMFVTKYPNIDIIKAREMDSNYQAQINNIKKYRDEMIKKIVS